MKSGAARVPSMRKSRKPQANLDWLSKLSLERTQLTVLKPLSPVVSPAAKVSRTFFGSVKRACRPTELSTGRALNSSRKAPRTRRRSSGSSSP